MALDSSFIEQKSNWVHKTVTNVVFVVFKVDLFDDIFLTICLLQNHLRHIHTNTAHFLLEVEGS